MFGSSAVGEVEADDIHSQFDELALEAICCGTERHHDFGPPPRVAPNSHLPAVHAAACRVANPFGVSTASSGQLSSFWTTPQSQHGSDAKHRARSQNEKCRSPPESLLDKWKHLDARGR